MKNNIDLAGEIITINILFYNVTNAFGLLIVKF